MLLIQFPNQIIQAFKLTLKNIIILINYEQNI